MKKAIYLTLLWVLVLTVGVVSAQTYIGLNRLVVGTPAVSSGYAIHLDNDDDYVNVPNSASLTFTTAITAEAWFIGGSADGVGNFRPIIVSGYSGPNEGYFLGVSSGKFRFTAYNGSTSVSSTGDDAIDDTAEYHVVGRMNATHTSMYINGVLNDENVLPAGFGSIDGEQDIYFGRSDRWLNATIDEIRLYTRCITPAEITYSYNLGVGIETAQSETNLVGWWHCNDGTGTNVEDATANNNDGTIGNEDGDEWVTGLVVTTKYPASIYLTNLLENYNVTLYDDTTYIDSGLIDSDGNLTLTVADSYLADTFEGTFKVFDDSADHLYTVVYDDTRGGDIYEATIEGVEAGFVLSSGLLLILVAVPVIVFVYLVLGRKR